MIEWASILTKINAQGIAGLAVAAVLGGLMAWQGCEHRAADRATERMEANYLIAVEQAARFKINAEDWRHAAEECSRQTEAMRKAHVEATNDWMRELRTARAERRVSELKYNDLRRRVEEGSISVRELLVEVQKL